MRHLTGNTIFWSTRNNPVGIAAPTLPCSGSKTSGNLPSFFLIPSHVISGHFFQCWSKTLITNVCVDFQKKTKDESWAFFFRIGFDSRAKGGGAARRRYISLIQPVQHMFLKNEPVNAANAVCGATPRICQSVRVLGSSNFFLPTASIMVSFLNLSPCNSPLIPVLFAGEKGR